MKRFFIVILVFSALFVFKSAHADLVSAQTPPPAIISGVFSNAQGSIAIKVTTLVKKGTSGNSGSVYDACGGAQTVTVAAFSSVTVTCVDPDDYGSYTLKSWYNSCGDGGNAVTTPMGGGSYTFTGINAHCTNTNSTLSITASSCTDTNGSVSWQVNTNSDGTAPNIKSPFKVYKSAGVADTDTSPGTLAYVPGPPPTTSYTLSNITLPATGNYNVSVKAFANDPNNLNSYSVPGLLTCSGSMVPPTNLVAVPSCNGTTPVVSFTWTGAGPTPAYTFAYSVETSTSGATGPWSGSITPSPTSLNYVNTSTLTAAQTYWAHVKAVTPSSPFSPVGNLFSASVQFTVPTCVVSSATPPVFPTYDDVITCASTTDNGDLTDNRTDDYTNAVPDRAKITWTRATQSGSTANIQVEQLQYTTDSSFAAPSTINYADFTYKHPSGIHFGSIGMDIITGLTLNATYYFRVKTQMSDNSWVTSEVRPFRSPTACFDNTMRTDGGTTPPGIVSGIASMNYQGFFRDGFGYCIGTQSYVRLGIVINKQDLLNYPNTYSFLFHESVSGSGGTRTSLSFSGPKNYYGQGEQWLADGAGVTSNFGIAGNITPPSCTSATAPSNLTSQTIGCSNGTSPLILFQFIDNSTNESGFNIDISSVPFSDNPTTYGTKTLPSTSPSSYGGTWSWWWSDYTSGGISPLDSVNANPQTVTTADDLLPLEGITYYWRVRANGTGANSVYKYDDGTAASSVYPSGRSFTMPYCSPRSDLSAKIVSMQDQNGKVTQSFQVGDTVTVKFRVANEPVSGAVNNPATKLYYYYNGVGVPNCATNNPDNNLSGPLGPNGVQRLSVDIPAPPGLIPTESREYSITFTATQMGGFTGYGYIVPSCVMVGGKDPNFANNGGEAGKGFSYTVGTNKFFETQGGDVGTKGNISIGVPRPGSYNISDYLIAGNDSVSGNIGGATTGLKVNSTTGRKLSGYQPNQVLGGGGVYEYFRSRFWAKAIINDPGPGTIGCNPNSMVTYNQGNYLYYCSDKVNIDTPIAIRGFPVFFIDGDLNINADLTLASATTYGAVYIVKGNINVATGVHNLTGIFITKKGFVDGTNGGEILSGGKLTITGALYIDAEDGGKLQLDRHYGGVDWGLNATTPSETIIYDPRNLSAFSTILSSSSVGWKEVAP